MPDLVRHDGTEREAGMTDGGTLNAKSNKAGSVRIIAGDWRGRRLPVPDVPGLRPSGDRSRETLFNWLHGHLRGAVVLDLFAGTGVLGLEAVSRGAASAVLVEKSRQAAAQLRASVEMLTANRGSFSVSVVEADALQWLGSQPSESFDLVFIDPPFGQDLAAAALQELQQAQHLKPGGLVYLETARAETLPPFAAGWEVLKEQALGEVKMYLLRAFRS